MAGDPENSAAAGAGGTSPARLRLHRAAVSAIHGLTLVASASLATLSMSFDSLNLLMQAAFCTLLVSSVDTALEELLVVDQLVPACRTILQAGESVLACAVGAALPALAAMAPAEGRLVKIVGISTVGLAALGTAKAASSAERTRRAILRSVFQALVNGWSAILLEFLIISVLGKKFGAEMES